MAISIHTLRVEGDMPPKVQKWQDILFQSTPSVWRVTLLVYATELTLQLISIHTLRVEGDDRKALCQGRG